MHLSCVSSNIGHSPKETRSAVVEVGVDRRGILVIEPRVVNVYLGSDSKIGPLIELGKANKEIRRQNQINAALKSALRRDFYAGMKQRTLADSLFWEDYVQKGSEEYSNFWVERIDPSKWTALGDEFDVDAILVIESIHLEGRHSHRGGGYPSGDDADPAYYNMFGNSRMSMLLIDAESGAVLDEEIITSATNYEYSTSSFSHTLPTEELHAAIQAMRLSLEDYLDHFVSIEGIPW